LAVYSFWAFLYVTTGFYVFGYFDVTCSFGLLYWTSRGEPFGDPPVTLTTPSPFWLLVPWALTESLLALERFRRSRATTSSGNKPGAN